MGAEKNFENLFIVETKEELPERKLAIAYNGQVPVSKAIFEFLKYFDTI